MKVLGVILDNGMSFQKHTDQPLHRAKVRMGLLTRVSGFTWGHETNELRATADALIPGLSRYGLSVVGSGANEQSLRRIDTCIINVAARRVLGAGRSASLSPLHVAAGMQSIHNPYTQHCAELLGSSLRATASTIQCRKLQWVQRVFRISNWTPGKPKFISPEPLEQRVCEFRFFDVDVEEEWPFSTIPECPQTPAALVAPSVYFTDAPEIELKPNPKSQTSTYYQAKAWFIVGIEILLASGWRPDCAKEHKINVTRALPPVTSWDAPIILQSKDAMRHPSLDAGTGNPQHVELEPSP